MIFRKELQNSYQNFLLFTVLLGICLLAGCGEQNVAIAENEFEANMMFTILHSNGFDVDKISPEGEVKTWQIVVNEGWFGDGYKAAAVQVLSDYGLPRPPQQETKANDSFGIVSEREEKERQKRDLQNQLERQLYGLPDVIRASVIIAQPTDDILSLEKTPPSASVTLVVKAKPKFTAEEVKSQLSGGVANLKPENVSVTISQQSLREVPIKQLDALTRRNEIFAVGIGIVVLLAAILGVVWMISKRRKDNLPDEFDQLTEGDENLIDTNGIPERPLLKGEDEE